MRGCAGAPGSAPRPATSGCGRAATAGTAALADRSRRPHAIPAQTPPAWRPQVVAVRPAHPTWGGRKIHDRLVQQGVGAVPAPSTITGILRRHGLLGRGPDAPRRVAALRARRPQRPVAARLHGPPPRRGRAAGPPADPARRPLPLRARARRLRRRAAGAWSRTHLTACFRRYGLPLAILTDNGPPWGTSGAGGVTALEAWLLRLGIGLWHGRAYHPQTQGKVERFHGTIAADVFAHRPLPDLAACQAAFDGFRQTYNQERPHEALA